MGTACYVRIDLYSREFLHQQLLSSQDKLVTREWGDSIRNVLRRHSSESAKSNLSEGRNWPPCSCVRIRFRKAADVRLPSVFTSLYRDTESPYDANKQTRGTLTVPIPLTCFQSQTRKPPPDFMTSSCCLSFLVYKFSRGRFSTNFVWTLCHQRAPSIEVVRNFLRTHKTVQTVATQAPLNSVSWNVA